MVIEQKYDLSSAGAELTGILGDEKVRLKEPLARHSTFRVGGPADVMLLPESIDDLRHIMTWVQEVGISWIVLGNGSNILFSDAGFRGLVIKVKGTRIASDTLWHLSHTGTQVTAGAGISLARLASYCATAGLSGMEWGTGIPGVVGGALKGNAGAHGWEMGDVVADVELMSDQGILSHVSNDEAGFQYRHTDIQGDVLITRATFTMTEDDPDLIRKRIQEYTEYRKGTQPSADQSAGCMFKNPVGESAGRLIDVTGCKGMSVGDAMVSTLHGNFIINRGQATATDTLALIDKIRTQVFDNTGIELVLEVSVVEDV